MERGRWIVLWMALAVAATWCGCGRAYYRRSADKEVYRILRERQAETLGKTNSNFTINTRYSARQPKEIRSPEIVHERLMSAKQPMSLAESLQTAVANSREYQYKKETVYLTALALTMERYNFRPKWASSSKMTFERKSDGEMTRKVESDISATELFKTGGQLAVSIANDMLRYYTGDPRAKHTTLLAGELVQPLLRGAGWVVTTEKLTQAERNVIYDVRDFAHYERTFAVD
ncbi:MAG: hypothetical protein FJ388_24230, partial [Verrucomicrobia bacterium]|nr:hypothetical protein [Verrucomicrobiota bacterium]